MNHRAEFSRENITYEEFVILCANLKYGEREQIINPINSLDAKNELSSEINKRDDFFEFCVNNFSEMHHHESKSYLLMTIYQKLISPYDIPFSLYDILIEKFFIEFQNQLLDSTINLIYKIQTQLFYFFYDQEFWMQLFVCEDCSTYMLKQPEFKVIGFINSLIDEIINDDEMNHFIKKMTKDGIFSILINYLYEKILSNTEGSIDVLNKIIEILDYSIISEIDIFESFLNELQEGSVDSVKFLSALFTKKNSKCIISIEEKSKIIDFIEQKNFFNYFNEYLIHQTKEGMPKDYNSIFQFSILLYKMFYPLLPQNLTEKERDENEFLFPMFDNFCPIFFQTLLCLEKMSDDYSKLLLKVSILLPDKKGELLDILLGKLNDLITNSQIDFNSIVYMFNYLKLYKNILQCDENKENEEEVYISIFQGLGAGAENLDRTKSLLHALSEVIYYDGYNLSSINDINDDDSDDDYDIENLCQQKKITKRYSASNKNLNLIKSTVHYFDFILNEDFSIDDIGETLYVELVLFYSKITFEWLKVCDTDERENILLRLFMIGINHMHNFSGIISNCIKIMSDDVKKVEDIDSIALSLLTSLNRNLVVCGLKILNFLPLSNQQKDDIIIDAISNVIQSLGESSQDIRIEVIMPIFMSTSVDSINNNKSTKNGGSGGDELDPQIVNDIRDFLMNLKGQMNNETIILWAATFLHFFGYIFFDDARDIFDPIFQSIQEEKEKSENNEEDFDFDFEKVTILARELKKTIPLAVTSQNGQFDDHLDFIISILVPATGKCERLIKEFTFDAGDIIFNSRVPRPQNFLEAKDFAIEASEFFITLFSNTQLVETYLEILPFLKMCCTLPILKSEAALFSIFQFVIENDSERIGEFLQCSFNLIHFIVNNSGHLSILFAVARFHRLLVKKDKEKFLKDVGTELFKGYLKVLCDNTIELDSKFREKIKEVVYKKRF